MGINGYSYTTTGLKIISRHIVDRVGTNEIATFIGLNVLSWDKNARVIDLTRAAHQRLLVDAVVWLQYNRSTLTLTGRASKIYD